MKCFICERKETVANPVTNTECGYQCLECRLELEQIENENSAEWEREEA